jgi:hypothetical protein
MPAMALCWARICELVDKNNCQAMGVINDVPELNELVCTNK